MANRSTRADEEFFAEWVCAHGKAVRGFVLALVGRADWADDLTQETFCRAWRAREQYSERGSARGYLLKIADRLVQDRGRLGPPPAQLTEDGWRENEPVEPSIGPPQLAMVAERQKLLEAALNKLTPLQRRTLMLRYYGKLGFAEIAAQIGCPLNTALSHARRGLESLRQILGDADAC